MKGIGRRKEIVGAVALVCVAAGGMASARAEDDDMAGKIDALFSEWDSTRTPGCAVAVSRNGEILYSRGYGMANLEYGVANQADTIFHVASVSKQFTAAAIVLLALDGKLSLDDPVSKYIDEMPDVGEAVTIRQLVHHTSGLRDQWDLLDMAGWRYSRDLITNEDALAVLARQKELDFEPGAEHSYSNSGYTLMAEIVARVSGQSFREFTTARIFEPLGMKKTFFRDDFAEIIQGFAYGYGKEDGKFVTSVTNFDSVGATSLLTTAEDLMLWEENFHTGKVGGERFLEQMLQKGRLNSGKEISYAFGIVHDTYRRLPTIDHSGADAGYLSHLIRFPEQGVSIACLCNYNESDPSAMTVAVADVVLADELGPKDETTDMTSSLSDRDRERFAGTYAHEETGRTFQIAVKDDRFFVERGSWSEPLLLVADDRMHSKGGWLKFHFQEAGRGGWERLDMIGGGDDPVAYERIEAFEPAPESLGNYAGIYKSEEFDMRYVVALTDDKLTLSSLKLRPEDLDPVMPDVFSSGRHSIRFHRGADGAVNGAGINTGGDTTYRFTLEAPGADR